MATKKALPIYSGLDPMTGLPVTAEKQEFDLKAQREHFFKTGNFIDTSAVPDLGGQTIPGVTPEELAGLPKFGGWTKGEAEDARAEQQSIGESLMFGAGRLLSTTGTKALSGISSLGEFVVNTGRATSQGSLDPYADTPVTDFITSIEDSIKESMPIYNTRADQSKNFLQRAFTDLDYWTNDIVDGAAFLASAWITGFGTAKMLGPLTKAAYANKLEQATKLAGQELAAVEQAAANGSSEAIQILKANALQKSKLAANITNTERLIATGISRSTESLLEGRQTYQTIYNDLVEKGYNDQEAKSEAAKGAMLVSGLNMLLAPLDYDQYGSWFKTYSKSRNALFKVTETGAIKSAMPSFGKALLTHAGRNAFTEGILEEGLQQAMQTYAQKKYSGAYGAEDVGAIEGTLEEYLNGFATKEGWDAMGAGMIIGGLFGGISKAVGVAGKQAKERTQQLQSLLANNDYLKSNMSSYVVKDEKTGKYSLNKEKIVADIVQQAKDGAISKDMVKALSLDYEEAYKTLDNIRFSNWAFAHFEAGLGEHLMDKIENLGKLNDQELKEQGILTDDMTNSEGKLISPSEIVGRYKEKALELEELYNQTAARFDIPSRAVHKNIFEEAVLQKETATSLEKINSKINDLKSKIFAINTNTQTAGKPVEDLEKPIENSPEAKQLEMLENRKQDLINTLKDSYKRFDDFTNPKKLEAQKNKSTSAEILKTALEAATKKSKEAQDAAKKAQDEEVAFFYNANANNVFKGIQYGKLAEDDYVFATNRDNTINPNYVVGVKSGTQVATKEIMPLVTEEKISTKDDYLKTKTVEQRIDKLEALIAEDNAAQLEVLKEIEKVETELTEALAQIEELKNFREVADKRFKKGFKLVAGTKAYTLAEYQQALDKAIALRDSYQKQLDKLTEVYYELEETIQFFKDYQGYLSDPTVATQEKLDKLEAFEADAANKMSKYSQEFESLSAEYSDKIKAVNQKISNLDILINALQEIIYRKKIERILAQSDIKDLEEIIDTLNLGAPELEFLRLIKDKEKLSKNQQVLLTEGFKAFMQENPGLAEELLGYGDMLEQSRAKNALLSQEIKDLEKQLVLAKNEIRDLENAGLGFLQSLEDAKKQFEDLSNSNSFSKTLERIKKAFSEVVNVFQKTLPVIREPKVKAAQTATNNSTEPSNLEDSEFKNGLPDAAIRDIIDVLNGTAGNNMVGNTDEITSDPAQRLWFTITEKLDPKKLPDFTLRAVSKKNNPFKEDFSDNKFEFNGKPVIYLVLYYKGEPIRIVEKDNTLIYTTMHETPTLERAKERYRVTMSDEELQNKLEEYEDIRQNILNNDSPVYFKVQSKSAGVKAEGETGPVVGRIVKTDAEIKDVDINIVTSDTVSIAGRQFENVSKKRGFVLIGHKGQIVNVQLPTMEEIPGAVDYLMAQINDFLANVEKDEKKSKTAVANIKALINFGNYKGADFTTQAIFYDFKTKKFIFAGKEYDPKDINLEDLRAFLNQKLFNVDRFKLKDNKKFTDPLTKKTYPSYKHYLMSAEGRSVDQIPVKVNLALLQEQQFYNVYLKFDYNQFADDPSKEEELDLDEPEVTDTTEVDDVVEEAAEKVVKTSTGKPKKSFADMSDEEIDAMYSSTPRELIGGFGGESDTKTEVPGNEDKPTPTEKNDLFNVDPDSVDNDPWASGGIKPLDKLYEGELTAAQEQLDAEEAWFKSAFPQFADAYERVKGLIAGKAIGRVTAAGEVLISDLAVAGTTYHEAWHVVSQFLLTPQERESLYKEYRDRTGRNIKGLEVEEAIAEEFRSYMLTGTSNIPSKQSLFDKIIKWLKALFKVNQPGTIEEVFKNIKEGGYAKKNIVSRPSRNFNQISGMSVEMSEEANRVLTSALLTTLFNGKFDYNTLNNLHKIDLAKVYDMAFEGIRANFVRTYRSETPPANSKILFGKDFTKEEWARFKNELADNVALLYNKSKRAEIIQSHAAYLAQFGLLIEPSENTTANDNVDSENPTTGNYADWVESIKFSPKQDMKAPLRMMLLSVADSEFKTVDGKKVVDYKRSGYFGVPATANFENTMNYMQEKLAGLTSGEQMLSRLNELAVTNPIIPEVLRKLKASNGFFASTLSLSEVLLQGSFIQQFGKTKHEYKLSMINPETGEIYQIDSNSEALREKMVSVWKATSKRGIDEGKSFYKLEDGQYVFDAKKFEEAKKSLTSGGKPVVYNINNINHNLFLLKKMGIPMTRTGSQYSEEERALINRAIAKIVDFYVKDKEATMQDMFASDKIKSYINTLAALELPYTNEAIELSHLNPEGETVYSITLNNYLSLLVNKINNDGIDSLEHLKNDLYSKNSIWKEILKGNAKAIKLVIIEGQKINAVGQEGKITSKLTPGDFVVTQINNIMNNIYPLLRAGDKKLEYGFQIDMSDKVEDYLNVFKGYLTDELTRITDLKSGNRADIQHFNKQGKDLITFYYLQEKGIVDPSKVTKKNIAEIVNSEKVETGIKNYIKEQMLANKQVLLDYNIISNNQVNYINNGISTKIKGYAEIGPTISNLTLNKFLQDLTIRNLMANIEQTKLFLGDLAFFNHAKNDGPKRIGGVIGTKTLSITDEALNAWLSQTPRKDNKPVDSKISVAVFSDPVMNAKDFISKSAKNLGIPESDSFFDAFRKIDIADAQGYITLPEYREFLIRAVAWDTKYEKVYEKLMNGEELTKADLKTFPILKPQHFGPQENESGYTPLFLKFSLAPLIPSMIKGTKLEQLNNMMMAKGIGVATFGSAAKVGAIVNEGLVNAEGKINEDLELNTSTIDYKYFGLQLEPSDEIKTKVTFGTQFRKLILNNLLAEGKGKIIKIKDYATGKLKEVNTKDLVKNWNDVIDDLTRMEMNDLLDELKITKTKEGYLITNPNQFRDLLIKEALKRGVSTNVIMGLEMAINAANFNLDAVANKTKVENILMSLINNNLIKQTTFGDMKVQMSSFGTASTEVQTDSELKFYESGKDGVRHIEVMLPHWFKELYGVNVDMDKIDSRVLNFLGYRIPTQDYASMDVLVVKEFLPQSAGNTIVVPAELPAKGGSDFDIDKMTLFLPNYEFVKDSNGDYRVVYVSPEGNSKQSKQNRIIELASQILTSPDNYKSLIRSNTAKTLQSLNEDIKKAKGIDTKIVPSKGRMLEFATNVKTSLAFWTGKDGVGIAAQQNTHHSLSQQVDLKIPLGKTFMILQQEVPVKINLNHNKSEDKSVSYSMEYDVNKQHKISDLISEFLNAYVDIAKDPFILDLNAGTNTANVWFSLVRAGVPVEEIGYFINQPIVKDILDLTKTYQSQFLEAKNKDLWKSEIVEMVMKKYNITEAALKNAISSNGRKNLPQLKKNLISGTDNVKLNAQILVDYLVYSEIGNDLANIQRAITFDTAGVGKTRWQSRALLRNVDNALNNSVFQNAEKVIEDTLIKPFYEVAKMAADFYNQGYAVDIKKAEVLREQMFEATETALNAEEQGKLLSYMENEFLLYLLSKEKIDGKSLNTVIKPIFTGENSLAHQLNDLKTDPAVANNYLIQQLIPVINSNRASTDNIILFDSVFNSYQQDLFLQGFEELFSHPKVKVQNFAKLLMSLMILQGGPNMSPVTLYNLIPNSQFVDKFSKLIMSQFKESTVDTSSFIEEFYMNNWNKEDFVPSVHPKKLKDSTVTLKKDTQHFNKPFVRIVTKDTKGNRIIRLYKRGKESKESVVFTEVPKRGNGFYLKEYYGDMRNSTITANLLDSKPAKGTSTIKKASPEPSTSKPSTAQPAVQGVLLGPETKINIYAGTGENAELSNFAVRPTTYNTSAVEGLFMTPEGAFQAAKIAYTENLTAEEKIDNSLIFEKLKSASGAEAKALGRKIKGLNINDWNKDSSDVMLDILIDSFKQNPNALAKLLATGNATLTHTQDKTKWGTEFPKLLMEVRKELRGTQPAVQPVAGNAQALWDKHGKALTEKFGPGMKDVWFTKDAEWRAHKIKCL